MVSVSEDLPARVDAARAVPPLSEAGEASLRELDEALARADSFEDLPGKWQAAILEAEAGGYQPLQES
jgi:hypothetical protein